VARRGNTEKKFRKGSIDLLQKALRKSERDHKKWGGNELRKPVFSGKKKHKKKKKREKKKKKNPKKKGLNRSVWGGGRRRANLQGRDSQSATREVFP